MKSLQKIFTIAFCAFMFNVHIADAQNSLKDRFAELSLSGGAWLGAPSKIWSGRMDEYTKKSTSFLLKTSADYYLNQHFAFGLYVNFCPGYDHEAFSDDNRSTMFEYGVGLKPVFYFSDKTSMKVGANVGLRRYKSDYVSTTGRGLGVNCSVEIQHLISNSGSITFEPGFLAQPLGYANSDQNKYTYAPIFYLNVGYTISALK